MTSSMFSASAMQTNSSTATDPSNPGNVMRGGYEGESFTVRVLIVFFCSLAMYNALELIVLILFTFSRFSGLYFYSLLVSSICIIPYALGFILKFLILTTGHGRWFAVALNTIGWYGMVTGQSIVLWSRLHLLVDPGEGGQWTLQWTKWMIIIDAIILHIPTTVLSFGSNGEAYTATFIRGYNVMEKIQMCGFVLQELVLSSLYISQTAKLLRNSMRDDAKKFLIQLVGINVVIIIMDLGLLATEAASLYVFETIIKGTIYSIKLKLEFAVLGKLILFVGGGPGTSQANEERWRQASIAYMGTHDRGQGTFRKRNRVAGAMGTSSDAGGDLEISDIVDLSKMKTSNTAAAGVSVRENNGSGINRIRTGRGITSDEIDLVRFEHVEDAPLPDMEKG